MPPGQLGGAAGGAGDGGDGEHGRDGVRPPARFQSGGDTARQSLGHGVDGPPEAELVDGEVPVGGLRAEVGGDDGRRDDDGPEGREGLEPAA